MRPPPPTPPTPPPVGDIEEPLLAGAPADGAPLTPLNEKIVKVVRAKEEVERDVGPAEVDTSSDVVVLAVSTAFVLLYLVAGVTFFMYEQQQSLAAAVYASVTIMTTVGFGDIYPHSTAGKLFVLGYVLVGVGFIASALGVLASHIAEAQQARMDKLVNETGLKGAMRNLTGGEEAEASHYLDRELGLADKFNEAMHNSYSAFTANTFVHNLLYPVLLAFACLLTGAVFMHFRFGWPWIDCWYASVITLSTVGYGDYSFDPAGKPDDTLALWFASAWMLIGTVCFGSALVGIASIPLELREKQLAQQMLQSQKLSMRLLFQIGGTDGQVDKHEWLMYMLKAMNKVTDDDIDVIMQQFDALDCDGSGYLDMDDLKNASNLRDVLSDSSRGPPDVSEAMARGRA